jgi:uncharacterized membrane protein YdjX (TVP38/TMEM64 family)
MEYTGSLRPLIQSLRMISPYKHLADFKVRLVPEDFISWVDAELLDMDQPSTLELAMDRWGRTLEAMQRPLKIPSRMLTFVMTGLAGVSIAASHVWMLQPWTQGPWYGLASLNDTQFSGLLLIPIFYLMAYLVFAPINLLILLTAGFFPTLMALPYIVLGMIGLVCAGYAAGRTLGHRYFPSLYGQHKAGDVTALCLLQAMPIVPHTLVNAAAGAAGVPFFPFIIATLIGMIPGCIMLHLFQRSVIHMFLNPGWATAWPLLLLIVLVCGVFRWSSRRFSNYGSR